MISAFQRYQNLSVKSRVTLSHSEKSRVINPGSLQSKFYTKRRTIHLSGATIHRKSRSHCHVHSWFNQDTVGFPWSVPGCTRVLVSPRASFPVARCKSGVPTVQNEQGRKWDIQLNQSAASVVFAEDLDVFRTYRDRQTTDCPQISSIRSEKVCSAMPTFFFRNPISTTIF